MFLETFTGDPILWAPTDLATTSYSVSMVDTTTEPVRSATRAILDLGDAQNQHGPNLVHCTPILTGAAEAVITGVRVFGWSRIRGTPGTTTKDTWHADYLFELAMIAATATGVSGGIIPATYYYMDSITYIWPTAEPVWMNVSSPIGTTADQPAWFRFDPMGYRKVEIVVDLGLNATGFNCLVRKY